MRDLTRLLRPRSIALFGSGWAANVAQQLLKSGYDGQIWPVHPTRDDLLGLRCYPSVDALPEAPDAAFVGVNREASIEVIAALAARGAGGATCFASGFLESEGEGSGGADLQARLIAAAGQMPMIGPNCYGILNYLDNVTLWPDQHGGVPVTRGVAIIAQSSNVAINLTMQARGLPIAYVITAGNQAQTGVAEIAAALMADDRVSVIGLYLEGFGDIRALEAFAATARKPVVVLKTGRSEKARAAGVTHTASLAGGAAAAGALIRRLGFVEVASLGAFLEALKLLDAVGPLTGRAVCSVSCSGGEASLMADAAEGTRVQWRDLTPPARGALREVLGPIVTVANPLDYHTFIWGDVARQSQVFTAVAGDSFDLVVFVLDLPRADRCDPAGYDCAVQAIIAARQATGARIAVLASLPENLSEAASARFAAAGIATLHGMSDGIAAIDAAIAAGQRRPSDAPLILSPAPPGPAITLDERAAKAELVAFGLPVPQSVVTDDPLAISPNFPVVLKALGIAHKTEAGAVVPNIADADALRRAVEAMPRTEQGYLVEDMITGGVAEVLVGITRDPSGLMMLTLGAGGALTELLADTAHLLLPATADEITGALNTLRIAPLLHGYRNRPAADLNALTQAILSICRYAQANAAHLIELDVNPIIARPHDAVAVDALIRLTPEAK